MLDITMPGWGGALLPRRGSGTACPATKVLMLTVAEDEDKLCASTSKAGARAYVLKGVSAHELARVVRSRRRARRGLRHAVAGRGDTGHAHAQSGAGRIRSKGDEGKSEILKLVVGIDQPRDRRSWAGPVGGGRSSITSPTYQKAGCAQPHGRQRCWRCAAPGAKAPAGSTADAPSAAAAAANILGSC